MIQRKTFPVSEQCEIAVTTERMADDAWAVVASVKRVSEGAEKVVDLPVPKQRFASQSEAEAFGLRMGRDWLEHNAA